VLDWDDALPDKELKQAERESASAALSLVLGSSLQIHPSCDIPLKTTRKRRMAKDPEADRVEDVPGKLVIVNLQPTKKDKKAHMVVHAPCDRVMRLVAKHLGLTLEPYVRRDCVKVAHECRASTSGSGYVFTVRIFNAHDENAPVPWIEKLDVAFELKDIEGATLRKHPLRLKRACSEDGGKILVWLTFHFASGCTEPPERVQYEVSYESKRAVAYEFTTMRKTFE
jgi:mono-ADP-ribosyltransferase sirtuin 6